ncbi:MAG: universal stress protein [Pseudomonadota bacterium]|nr:universal stress protein [Pseudomonadota bacterium]
MKRILVATDLSERSDRAIDRAVSLCKEFGAHLSVLHVIDEDLPVSIAEEQRRVAERDLREHLFSLRGAEDVAVDFLIDVGKDWMQILRRSESDQFDLVVLGMHRARGLAGLFRGTTVERVVRNGDMPVLVVKDRATKPYQQIAVGIDFSVYSRRALEFALGFAPKAQLRLLHIYSVPFKTFLNGSADSDEGRQSAQVQLKHMVNEEMKVFVAGLEKRLGQAQTVIVEGDPQRAIREQIKDLNANLLVLGTHGRTGMARALLGSVAEDFLADPPCDIMVVKAW